MKKIFKILTFATCVTLLNQNIISVFAQDTSISKNNFDPKVAFSKYNSYKNLKLVFFAVSSSEHNNKYAIFEENKQKTDFIYSDAFLISAENEENIDTGFFIGDTDGIVVTQKINDIKNSGLINLSKLFYENVDINNPEYLLPIKYKNIEIKRINRFPVYIAENFDATKEYYLKKSDFDNAKNKFGNNGTFNIKYEEKGEMLKINSLDDVPKAFKENIPIKGLDGVYIQETFMENYFIVDKNGKKLINTEFREVDNKLSPGDTLVVWYPVGHSDASLMVLNKNLEIIVPENGYAHIEFLNSNGQIYIKVKQAIGGNETHYYDLKGNKLEKEPPKTSTIPTYDTSSSEWARKSIDEANNLGIVPQNLQYNYKNKITRQEFCQLAMQTYITKTGNTIDMNAKSPFKDVNDSYVTAAYNLKIVSGTGKGKFSPNNNITRQEAAVMINNLSKILNINTNSSNKNKFVDENYFASWAKNAIYSVSSIKIGDIYVMSGTGNGKFSPWFNYTREQAIATMLRIYKL